LRWAAVLGTHFDAQPLGALTGSSFEPLVDALESLERHAFLRAHVDEGGRPTYAFCHDLLQRAVYNRISEPRRRLMHRRIAEVLESSPDESQAQRAVDLARHAALGGDHRLAAHACLQAGRRCLRLFANGEARAFVERGLRYVASLEETQRVPLEIHLRYVEAHARRTDDVEPLVDELLALAERAIDCGDVDAARIAFLVVGLLHWEGGTWDGAERAMARIASIGRAGDDASRVQAMGEAGHCLALLERDLPRAEAMLLEARSLCQRRQLAVGAVSAGLGILHRHRGEPDEARALLEDARAAARVDGAHWSEFEALVQLVEVDYELGDLERAALRASELSALAEKMREGSEVPYARAMRAVIAHAQSRHHADTELREAIDALRASDAMQRLTAVLLYAGELDLERGDCERALARASEALALAKNLERKSDKVLALALVASAAKALGSITALEAARSELGGVVTAGLSRRALSAKARMLEGSDDRRAGSHAVRRGAGR
jgi:tetratricopeptide (TPR) repeat protein